MSIACHPHCLSSEPQFSDQVLHLLTGQRGSKRLGEQSLLFVVFVACVPLHQLLHFALVFGANKISEKEGTTGRNDTDRFGDYGFGVGDMMNDAIRHHTGKATILEFELFGVVVAQLNSSDQSIDFDAISS